MRQFLFTYGTLSNGKAPVAVKRLMRKLTPVGEAYVQGRLYDLGKYPGLKSSRSPRQKVHGRVFELPDDPAVLKKLDEYEEYSEDQAAKSLFIRKRVPARLENGKQVNCWTYFYNGDVTELRRIPSGDYSKALA
jgi:gamma-glutamylcyclotransferase (GGCT)/AIG2-like uncharacterized protein YtfP